MSDQLSFDQLEPDLFNEQHAGTWTAPQAQSLAGITYRQLDYWARTSLVVPSVRAAGGSGSQRLYSFFDLVQLRMVKRILDAGISLQNIRIALERIKERGPDNLAGVTVFSDGASIYEVTEADEIIDLLQGGQGVFGIALKGVIGDVQAKIAKLPVAATDPADASAPSAARTVVVAGDELAERRQRRAG